MYPYLGVLMKDCGHRPSANAIICLGAQTSSSSGNGAGIQSEFVNKNNIVDE